MIKRPIIVVDGMNVFVRNFLVNESMSAKSEPIGGVVGFLRHLDGLINKFAPSKLIVVWENGGGCPRRKALFPGYKENRAKMFKSGTSIKDKLRQDTDSKIKQLNILYQILQKTPVCQIFIKETECDDIIGYLVRHSFVNDERTKIIVSGDKDFYQLLDDDSIKIYDPARKILLDGEYVKKTFGISARNFCLARTFDGDVSDNVEGVPGVGLKTVVKRFPKFADDNHDLTLDEVLEDAKNLLKTNKKLKAVQEILSSEDILKRNWKLFYLNSSNLSASQIEKINGTLEMHEPKLDKLAMIKEVTKAGINISFDFDRFSLSLKKSLIFEV
jgi:5'-3' exonuclease